MAWNDIENTGMPFASLCGTDYALESIPASSTLKTPGTVKDSHQILHTDHLGTGPLH